MQITQFSFLHSLILFFIGFTALDTSSADEECTNTILVSRSNDTAQHVSVAMSTRQVFTTSRVDLSVKMDDHPMDHLSV